LFSIHKWIEPLNCVDFPKKQGYTMNPELSLLADARQAERTTQLTQRALRPQMPTLRLLRKAPIARPTLIPIVPRKDVPTVTSMYFGNQSQLIVADTMHEEMVRNVMLRQQLRDARVREGSIVTTLRSTMANALFTLAQAVKPAGEANGSATPHPAA
jgi:hypothetical protein